MDFTELPDGICPEEVPDLGGPEYDKGPFSIYSERQGWNLTALLRTSVYVTTPSHFDFLCAVRWTYQMQIRKREKSRILGSVIFYSQ